MRTRFLSNLISCIILLLLLDLAFAFSSNANLEVLQMQIKITSTAFKEGEFIPSKYTCDGKI